MAKISSPAILLLGDPGAGKTFAAAKLAQYTQLVYVFTDPGGDESLLDALEFYKIPVSKVHWRYVPPASPGWDAITQQLTKVNSLDYQTLAGMKSGINKQDHRQFLELISTFADFECQRTGKKLGPLDELDETYSVVYDSLSGLNQLAKDLTVGAKPTLHEGEWHVAMTLEENFINTFTANLKCPRMMIGHFDKSQDITGAMVYSVNLLGRKLAPKIPAKFSDVVKAYSEGGKFFWSTVEDRMTLKTRNLALSDKLPPDVGPLIERWKERKARAEAEDKEEVAS